MWPGLPVGCKRAGKRQKTADLRAGKRQGFTVVKGLEGFKRLEGLEGLEGLDGLERFRAGKRQTWTPIRKY